MRVTAVVERAWRGLAPSGGAETMIADLMEYLAKEGWDSSAAVINMEDQRQFVAGVDVLCSRNKNKIWDYVLDSDLILTHLGGTPRAVAMGKKMGIPVAQLIHNTNEYSMGWMGNSCDFAIYNSDWVRKYHNFHRDEPIIKFIDPMDKRTYVRKRKCFEWPYMVLRPPITNDRTLGGDPDGYITLINLVPNKGPDILYSLAESHPELKFMGVIGGYEESRQVIRDLPNVLIHPHVLDISEIYSKTKILLVPSIYESYGRVAVEAMSYSIPVIASNTPGLQECLGPTGTFVDREDLIGWSTEIQRINHNYDDHQSRSLNRYLDLQDQTVADLLHFKDEMEGLVNQWRALLP